MGIALTYDSIPWVDASKWKPGCWYPLPVSSVWTDPKKGTWFEGYDIFYQDPEAPDDIIPIGHESSMTFRQAIMMCEAHNGWSFDLG